MFFVFKHEKRTFTSLKARVYPGGTMRLTPLAAILMLTVPFAGCADEAGTGLTGTGTAIIDTMSEINGVNNVEITLTGAAGSTATPSIRRGAESGGETLNSEEALPIELDMTLYEESLTYPVRVEIIGFIGSGNMRSKVVDGVTSLESGTDRVSLTLTAIDGLDLPDADVVDSETDSGSDADVIDDETDSGPEDIGPEADTTDGMSGETDSGSDADTTGETDGTSGETDDGDTECIPVAEIEICGNGIDDDCDGDTDGDDSDLDSLGTACDNGLLGACLQSTVRTCVDGEIVCETPVVEPTEEICGNDVDDDCDGDIDSFDSDLSVIGTSCDTHPELGACFTTGSWVCTDQVVVCNAPIIEPTEEVCDEIDNDCNGLTDNEDTAGVCMCVDSDDCDDSDPCTVDTCEGNACSFVPDDSTNGTACDDGNACTQVDICVMGSCSGADPIVCVASDSCHDAGICNEMTGACSNPAKADSTVCDDGNACSVSDSCQSGSCTAGSDELICNDGNPCTTDSCDSATGCVTANVSNGTECSDSDACNGMETCESGSCTDGADPVCNDGNPCTTDSCDSATGCVTANVSNGTECSDSDACNGMETCESGSCTDGADPVCNDGNPCTTDSCDSATGCVTANVSNGTECSDSDACNGMETCESGSCTDGADPVCNDGNPCTTDSCDSATGCVTEPNAASCDDGDPCTENEMCSDGVCQPGTPMICPDDGDGFACTSTSCNPTSGICDVEVLDHESCDDGDWCTDQACIAGAGCIVEDPRGCCSSAGEYMAHNGSTVVVTQGIEMDCDERTNAEYADCVNAGACSEPQDIGFDAKCNWGAPTRLFHPVNCVSQTQAGDFCGWLDSIQSPADKLLYDIRLPTWTEWFFAARTSCSNRGDMSCGAEDNVDYPWWGDSNSDPMVCGENAHIKFSGSGCGTGVTTLITNLPDGRGLDGHSHLLGNVSEWTISAGIVPGEFMKMGGSFENNVAPVDKVYLTYLSDEPPEGQYPELGFRCVKVPKGGMITP